MTIVNPIDPVGTTWQINDSGRRFVVVSVGVRYALVENLPRPGRRRLILRSALRTTRAKHGYTQLFDDAPAPSVSSIPADDSPCAAGRSTAVADCGTGGPPPTSADDVAGRVSSKPALPWVWLKEG